MLFLIVFPIHSFSLYSRRVNALDVSLIPEYNPSDLCSTPKCKFPFVVCRGSRQFLPGKSPYFSPARVQITDELSA